MSEQTTLQIVAPAQPEEEKKEERKSRKKIKVQGPQGTGTSAEITVEARLDRSNRKEVIYPNGRSTMLYKPLIVSLSLQEVDGEGYNAVRALELSESFLDSLLAEPDGGKTKRKVLEVASEMAREFRIAVMARQALSQRIRVPADVSASFTLPESI